MDKVNAWVSKNGRLSRKGYVLFFVAPLAGLVAFTWLTLIAGAAAINDAIPAALFVLPWMAFLATADAQNIKRWHDLGSTGAIYTLGRPFVILLPITALAVEYLLPGLMASAGDMGALSYVIAREFGGASFGPAPLAMFGLTIVAVIGNIVYLAAMPGQRGPNSFGPDPLFGASVPGFPAAKADDAADDPVKRALAEYQARSAAPAAMVTHVRPAPSGGGFGKKRR
jgi:uncharacterized membrane protein YhaH (DUF805 family)